MKRRVFDHYYGVGARRHRRAGHDGEGFAATQRGWKLSGTCFDFSDYLELGWKRREIGCVQRVAIARGSREGRDVAVGGDGLGEDSAGGLEQGYCLVGRWSRLGGMVFDYAAGVFEG